MARHEQDREDILREATALVERVELKVPDHAEPVIVGFRRDGSASLFFGADPVFQFNSAGELRRAYVAGRLIKAERGRLVALKRQRTETQVHLLRTELDPQATIDILQAAAHHLQQLGDHLRSAAVQVRGQVPATTDVVARVRDWLERLATPLQIAAQPHAR